MKRLRITTSHHAFVVGSHVHELAVSIGGSQPRRNHSGAHRHRLHDLEHHPVIFIGFSPNGEPKLASVTVHGPNGDGVKGAGAKVGAVAFEGDANEAAPHFFDELLGGDGEFKEERGFGVEAVVLDAEPDVAEAVAEDGPDDHRLGWTRRGLVGVAGAGNAFVGGG